MQLLPIDLFFSDAAKSLTSVPLRVKEEEEEEERVVHTLWEIAYAGCRAVRGREESLSAASEKDEENHLRCTCCAGGSSDPVLKVYQARSPFPPRPPRPHPCSTASSSARLYICIYSSTRHAEYLMALCTIIALQPSLVFRLWWKRFGRACARACSCKL